MDKSHPLLSIVIPHYNNFNILKECIESLLLITYKNYEIIIVDNCSEDNSYSLIKENFKNLNIYKTEKNLGYSGGCNFGAKYSKGDYILFLNNDTIHSVDFIEPLINFLEKNQDVSSVQPKIKNYYKKKYFDYAGAAGGFIDKYGFMFCAGRIFDSFESAEGNYTEDMEVFWASGASLFIDTKSWKEISGLDSDFFAHMEEIDLCWRLKNRGYKVGICGTSDVYHLGGGTLSKSSSQKVYLNFRNNLLLLHKNERGFAPLFILKRLILDGIAAFRFLLKLEFTFFYAVFKAHLVFYSMIPSTLRKRKAELLAQNSTTPNQVGRYQKSIIVDYFFNGKSKLSDLDKSKFD